MSSRIAAQLDEQNPDPDGVWSLRTVQRMLEAELTPGSDLATELTGPIRDPRTRVDVPESGDDDDDDIKVVSSGTIEAKPAAASSASTATTGAATQPDPDPIMIEDIVIEIDE